MTKKELIETHADYDRSIESWQFYARSYFGGERYREGNYLIQHPFESADNYTRRKNIAYFYNYCAPIVDIFVSLLYKKKPVRDYGSLEKDELFMSFLDDADMEGNSFGQAMRETQRYASIYGRVSVVVDKSTMEVATKAQENELDIRPYLSVITPENIINWSYVRLANGRVVLDSVSIVEARDKKGAIQQVRIWNRTRWELYLIDTKADGEDDLQPHESGTHNLGVVPIVNVYNKNTGTRMLGLSDLEDIAGINRNIYYLCSDAHEIIENTAFPMIAIPYEKGGQDETKEIGPRNILEFDPEAPGKPYWLEAPHSSLDAIREYIKQHRRTILQIANLLGIYISGESKQPVAGVAMEIENDQRNAVLTEKADNMEQSENQILTLWALWQGQEFDGKVEYSPDYSIMDGDREIQNALEILQRGNLQTFTGIKELQKKLIRGSLPKIDAEVRAKIYREIEGKKIDVDKFNGMKDVVPREKA